MKKHLIKYQKGLGSQVFHAEFEELEEAILFWETIMYLKGYNVLSQKPTVYVGIPQ